MVQQYSPFIPDVVSGKCSGKTWLFLHVQGLAGHCHSLSVPNPLNGFSHEKHNITFAACKKIETSHGIVFFVQERMPLYHPSSYTSFLVF